MWLKQVEPSSFSINIYWVNKWTDCLIISLNELRRASQINLLGVRHHRPNYTHNVCLFFFFFCSWISQILHWYKVAEFSLYLKNIQLIFLLQRIHSIVRKETFKIKGVLFTLLTCLYMVTLYSVHFKTLVIETLSKGLSKTLEMPLITEGLTKLLVEIITVCNISFSKYPWRTD